MAFVNQDQFTKIAQAYIDSRLLSEALTSSVDADTLIDIFVFESEFLLCAVSLLASFSTENLNAIPFTHLDMTFMNRVTVGQIADFCNIFAEIKKNQLREIFDARENPEWR